MRIVWCIPQLYRAGGMERVLTERVNALSEDKDISITIVTTESAPEGEKISFFGLADRVKLIHLGLDFDADFRLPLFLKAIRHRNKQRHYRTQLIRILREEKADWCVSMGGKELEWLGRTNIPCRKLAELHLVHDHRSRMLTLYHRGIVWQWMGKWLDWQWKKQVTRMDELIVPTESERAWWLEAGMGTVRCIPNFCCLTPDGTELKREKRVLAMGRLYPIKGFDLLLQAWQMICFRFPYWTLRIVGDGEQREYLERMARKGGMGASVCWAGSVEQPKEEYQHSEIFVLSSRCECQPLVVMEAMSQGCCVISFDCPYGPGEMIRDGEDGRLVPTEDVVALATALEEEMVNEESRRRMGRQAVQKVEEKWSREPILAQWRGVLFGKDR